MKEIIKCARITLSEEEGIKAVTGKPKGKNTTAVQLPVFQSQGILQLGLIHQGAPRVGNLIRVRRSTQ